MQRDRTSTTLDWKFADMPCGIANRWLEWSKSHDWGREAKFLDSGKLMIETDSDDGDLCVDVFSTPRELRDWAGY